MTLVPSHRRKQAGFTFLEIAVVMLILGSAFAAFATVFQSSEGLAEESRAALRAHEDLRRNLEAVANVVRGVDIDTLGGLDADGSSTRPTFQRVTGADMLGRTYDATETIFWVALAQPVDGIANAGQVVHEKAGVRTLLADRVPNNGFRVTLDGTTLVIHLTTYSSTSARRTATVSGQTAVSFRN
jgi:prepilin-type N-terminal cleavage/methylation domain-containing protein